MMMTSTFIRLSGPSGDDSGSRAHPESTHDLLHDRSLRRQYVPLRGEELLVRIKLRCAHEVQQRSERTRPLVLRDEVCRARGGRVIGGGIQQSNNGVLIVVRLLRPNHTPRSIAQHDLVSAW